MNGIGVLFLFLSSLAIAVVPRRFAPIALISGMVYLTKGQGIDLGGTFLQADRLLLVVALARVSFRSEWIKDGLTPIDKLVIAASVWALISSLFHEQMPGSGFVYTLGGTFSLLITYFVVRGWCQDLEDLKVAVAGLAILLLPVALGMGIEKFTGKNLFAVLGGTQEVIVREGIIRARGPFRHPILAGTVAAACIPLMIGIRKHSPGFAITGIAACLGMVAACHSSGPIVSLMVGVAVVAAWRFRRFARHAVWAAVIGYFAVEMISNRPAYTAIVTRLDLTGSSTAYYRARLITTTIDHFNEWWLIGTDFTGHWIPGGMGSKVMGGQHLDITNMYIARGVNEGLLGMLFLIIIVILAIRQTVVSTNGPEVSNASADGYFIWSLGAALGSLAVSGLSVSFFDQSSTFIWLIIAWTASAARIWEQEEEEVEGMQEEVGNPPEIETVRYAKSL